MCCSAQGFPRLQELVLRDFSIEEWRMEGEAMPRLSNLILFESWNMTKLPEGLLQLPCLKELYVVAKSCMMKHWFILKLAL
ncbi:hypothetical protein BAE44_0004019 [Dichanthelium oligosanthes]|uniref:Uncharacterized protein n=1 Tax=Dichanthelium oligosanthes TaxID=888268 RepID=A0A1E5WCB7_9POAL|nr:hypothetical protein BAE44_0004019 [Dichanthelium oligosanthes]